MLNIDHLKLYQGAQKYKIKRHQMKYLGLEIIDDKIKFNDNIQIEV